MADSNHLLEQNSKIRAEQITSKENRDSKTKEIVERLNHACKCADPNCTNVDCDKIKRTVEHFKMCPTQAKKDCKVCRHLLTLVWYHVLDCKSSHCLVPCCAKIKLVLEFKVNVASGIKPEGDVCSTQVSHFVEPQAGGITQGSASANTEERRNTASSLPVLQSVPPEMFNRGGNFLPLQEFLQRRPEESQGIRQLGQLAPQIIQGRPIGPMSHWTPSGPMNQIWTNRGPVNQMGSIGPMTQLGSVSSTGPMYQMGPLGQIQPGGNLTNPQNAPNKEALQQLMQVLREPQSLEQQQRVLAILKANPQLMAAFIKQRQESQLSPQINQGPMGLWTPFGPMNQIWTNRGPMSQMGPIGSMSQLGSMSSTGPMYQMGPLGPIGQIQPGGNLTNPQNAPTKEVLQQLPQPIQKQVNPQLSTQSSSDKTKKLGLDMDDSSSSSDQKPLNSQTVQLCIHSLVHACQCRDAKCPLTSCQKMKRVVTHFKVCKRKTNGSCPICKQLLTLCCYHAKYCQDTKCPVPFCAKLKVKLKQRQLQQTQLIRKRMAASRMPSNL